MADHAAEPEIQVAVDGNILIYNDCSPEKTGRPPVLVPVIFLFPSCYSPVNAVVKVTFPDWALDP